MFPSNFRSAAARAAVLPLLALTLNVACGSDEGPRSASRIEFTPDPVVLPQGDTLTLHATVVDKNGREVDNQSVSFESSNPGIVTVTPTGRLTSTGFIGPVSITATQGDVFTSIDITIEQVAGSVDAHPIAVALAAAGETRQLVPTIRDIVGDEMTGTVTYAGNNNAAFTVSPTGLVTAVANGTGKVTITSGTAMHQVDVFVGPVPAGTLLEATPVGGAPYSVAVSGTGKMILSLPALTKVARGDLPAYEFPTQLDVGVIQPLGVTMNPAGTKAYVGLPTGIAVVDLATDAVTVPITGVGQIFSVAVSNDGNRLYATSTGGRVFAINTATNAVTDSSDFIGEGQQVVVHPTQPLIYVVTTTETVELNATTLATVRTFATGNNGRGVAIAPDGSTLYVVAEASALRTVNLTGGAVTVTTGSAGFGVAVRGTELIIAGQDHVRFFNRGTLGLIRDIQAGSNNRRPTATSTGLIVVPDEDGSVLYLR